MPKAAHFNKYNLFSHRKRLVYRKKALNKNILKTTSLYFPIDYPGISKKPAAQ